MNKNQKPPSSNSSKQTSVYKNGYRPKNEGYKPITSQGGSSTPNAPKGGSGKSD
jgi:hypothetical protein